jgi:dTDP-L-rhamnose 4-epimerase
MSRVLVTGGAGFIGSRLVRTLVADGHEPWIYDSLLEQVHGARSPVAASPSGARLEVADMRDAGALSRFIAECRPEIVYHLAAETGTGQSYDEVARYSEVNITGTAHLIEALRRHAPGGGRIVLSSSRAVYGEGPHLDARGRRSIPGARSAERMRAGSFAPVDDRGEPLTPVPVREDDPPTPVSVYAATKLAQEHILASACAASPWSVSILRFQNVYGPGQSLSNPYTGVLSIFCAQALAGQTLNIFEDGHIVRDFVFIDDIVRALRAVAAAPPWSGPINVGSGHAATILDTARLILAALGAPPDRLRVSGDFRPGDIRHAVADISVARKRLGWSPQIPLRDGILALATSVRAAGASAT